MRFWRILPFLIAPLGANGQKFYTYITDLGPRYVELSWGTLDGRNTIGRSSPSHGPASIKVDNRTVTSTLNYVTVAGLQPDRDYTYEVSIGQSKIGSGQFHTWAETSQKLVFFVIGDYGTGLRPQYRVAEVMWREFQKRMNTPNPVRFMLSVGDNIYGNISSFVFGAVGTGADDRDWATKFFQPYEPLLARIPFFGTLGNHDGNETESHRDLPAFLDNFPFPNGKPGRYYSFTYGGVAKFLGLDSTKNTESGHARPNYGPESAQFQWMKQELAKPKPVWVIPFYHHPVFNAGPLHAGSIRELQHWVDLFAASGVKVVFNGHEHNFQMTEANDATHGIRFVTSGAGGELRSGNVQGQMHGENMAAWAPQNHFLVVEIDGKTMQIAPMSFEPMSIKDSGGQEVKTPVTITLP